MSIENNILDAIDIIVDRAIAKAGFDKTVTAFIVECINEAQGKYKVRYQDSVYEATSENTATKYLKNAEVYLLIPEGDFSKRKKILGTVEALGSNYIEEQEQYESYENIGINVIHTKEEIGLCSYDPDTELVLYQYGDNENNKLAIDNNSLKEYILQGSFLSIGANFRTELDRAQRNNGNYGLIFNLLFQDEELKEPVIKQYVLDIDNMIGQPYNFPNYMFQNIEFEISNKKFIRVESILAFAKDFRLKELKQPNDIFINDLKLQVAVPLPVEQSSSYYISFVTPKGIFFADTEEGSLEESASQNDSLLIQAEVKNKGSIVKNTGGKKLAFYWFMEHPEIDTKDAFFHIYGGQGWKCLNSFIETETGIEWESTQNILEIKKADMLAKEVRYKCVCLYDNSILIDKEILIKNLDAQYNITITSSKGTEFNLDRGVTTLTCLINGEEQVSDYSYYWSKKDSHEAYSKVIEDVELTQYLSQARDLMYDIDKKLLEEQIYKELPINEDNHPGFSEFFKFLWEFSGVLNPKNLTYEDTRYLLREYISLALHNKVLNNKIHNLDIKNIVNFITYSCAVFKKESGQEVFIGSSKIILVNSFNRDKANTLVLHNGNQIFKYDIKGVSPSSISKDQPIKPLALSFTIYDENGLEIEDGTIEKNYNIKWKVPKENTLLTVRDDAESEEDNYLIYSDLYLPFEIASIYNHNKNNNDIQLEVFNEQISLSAETNLSFLKEGSLNINGSEFFCRIVPNTEEAMEQYPMLTIFSDKTYKLNYEVTGDAVNWFKVQFWKLDKMLWEATSGENISWSILKNKYGTVSESSDIKVTKDGVFSLSNQSVQSHPANIVKVEVRHEGAQYFATFPLITQKQTNNNYAASLDNISGFHEVVYASDGVNPQYNTSLPFKFQVKKKVDDTWVDVSESSTIFYDFDIQGNIFKESILIDSKQFYLTDKSNNFLINNNQQYLTTNQSSYETLWEDVYLLEEGSMTSKKNEQYFTVKDTYNGQCVNAGFKVTVRSRAGNTLTQLHVPIHFLLDKNGHAALGDWDGNSIQINQEEGGSVLAPQTGAGHVDQESGSFTGVFMGSAADKDNNVRTGLLGYSKGQQSIFLDSETGRAEFGTTSKIIIDPENNEAKIYSGDYIEKGTLLADGTKSEGAGMIINLTTPEIKFGTENFKVDKEGKVTATDGKIAGWQMTSTSFYSVDEDDNPEIRFSNENYKDTIAGQYRDDWRFNIGKNFGITASGAMYSHNEKWEPGSDAPEVVIQNSGSFSGYFNIENADIESANFGENIVFQNDAIYIPKTYNNQRVYTTFNSIGFNDVAFATAAVSNEEIGVPGYNIPWDGTPLRLFHNGLAEFKNIDIQGGVINLYQAQQDKTNNVPLSKQSITIKTDANTEYTFDEYINLVVRNHNTNNNQFKVLGKLELYSQNGDNQSTHIYSALPLYADDFFIKERQIVAEEWKDIPVSIKDKIQALEDKIQVLEDRIAELERLHQNQE